MGYYIQSFVLKQDKKLKAIILTFKTLPFLVGGAPPPNIIVKSDKKLNEEEIEDQIRKQFKMKGLILADVKVIKMQDKNLKSGASKIIPAGVTAKGSMDQRYTNGINKEEFKILQKYIFKTIKEISKEILKGNIDLKPYNNKGKTPCDYCSYKSVCGFDTKNNSFKYVANKSNDDVVKNMEEKCKL